MGSRHFFGSLGGGGHFPDSLGHFLTEPGLLHARPGSDPDFWLPASHHPLDGIDTEECRGSGPRDLGHRSSCPARTGASDHSCRARSNELSGKAGARALADSPAYGFAGDELDSKKRRQGTVADSAGLVFGEGVVSAFRTIKVSDPRFERGGLRHVTVKSEALQQRVDLSLFLPESQALEESLPLVILLHGVYSSHWGWAFNGGAHLTAARLIESGEIPPLVLAMPSDGLWGDGSAYVPHEGKDFERWIVEEVPRATEEAGAPVSESSPRFLAGLSMGGFGALRLGAKFGARFRAISAHSSITRLEELEPFVEESLSFCEAPEEGVSALGSILAHRKDLPPMRFDCGLDDSLLDANRELHAVLEKEEVEHIYEEFPGGHEWSYWETHLVDTLRFFAGNLR